jgi:nucleolin
MASKSDKEKKPAGKTGSVTSNEPAKKLSPKSKKQMEDDDDDDFEDDEKETSSAHKTGKPVASSKKKSDEDDDDVDDSPDEWEKPEEEENWDPDFEEFDVPKSKGKKAAGKKEDNDDLGLEDEEFKDLFNDKDYDDDDEDDDY